MLLWSRSSAALTLDRIRLLGAGKAGLIAVALLAAGCSKQSEGERCDLLSGDQDCDSGLVCTALEDLRNGAEGAVCCPTDNPTESICRANTFDYIDDGGATLEPTPPSDAGTTAPGLSSSDVTTPDVRSSADAGADASAMSTATSESAVSSSDDAGVTSTIQASDSPSTLQSEATSAPASGIDAAVPDAGP